MIRRITIGVLNLIILHLPPKKRLQGRITWFQGLLYPYYLNEKVPWYTWRDEMIIRAKVSGETLSLQWYLNHLYDAELQRILIVDAIEEGVYMPLDDSEDGPIEIGLDTGAEADAPYTLPLTAGEGSSDLPVDFRVLVPLGIDVNQVKATVKLYNMAHKSFDIQTF